MTATIEQLSKTRDEIDHLLKLGAFPDLSPAAWEVFAIFRQQQEENAREWSILMAHLLPESELVWLVREMGAPQLKIVKLNQEFDQLEADESEDKLQELASRIVSAIREVIDTGNLSDQQGQRAVDLEDAMKKPFLTP